MNLNLFWIILLVILGVYIYKKNSNKPWKKFVGLTLIFLGIFIISPLPGLDDLLLFPIFSAIKGIELTMDNFSLYFLEYLLMTFILGGIMVYLGMRLLNWDIKKLWKKLDIGKYKIAVGLAILVVAIIAYLDIQGMIYWTSFSTMEAYTNGMQGEAFWNFFKSIAFSLMLIVPICYWFFVRKDKSEVLALGLSSYTLWMFGFADILYFIFQKLPIPEILSHLNNHVVIGRISSILGYSQVTNVSLLISVFVGFVVIFFMTKILKERF